MLARNHPRSKNYNPNDDPQLAIVLLQAVAWTVVLHPIGITLLALCVWLGEPLIGAGLFAVEVLVLLINPPFLPGWFRTWNKAMRFRRRWHRTWTSIVDAKHDTTLRFAGFLPMVSFRPRIQGSIATWTIRPPQAATLAHVADQTETIASQHPAVSEITVNYRKATDSKGQLTVTFGDPFTQPQTPQWTNTQKDPSR